MKIRDDSDNPLETYTYGASRNRLKNETSVQRTYYAWGGSSPIVEYTEATSSSTPVRNRSYVYAGSRLLSTATKDESGEKLEFHHPDRLGTTLVTDPMANTSFRQSTLPFGKALGAESTGYTNQVFTSYDRSVGTGLDYALNRSFSQGQSRFTQVDPIGLASTKLLIPQSMNLYSYVQNNPIDYVDPSGLYAACVHQAMTEYLAKKSRKVTDEIAEELGKYAGNAYWDSADAFANAATSPHNIQACSLGGGPSVNIHFPSKAKLDSNIADFSGYLAKGDTRNAAFMLHSVEDAMGAHKGYSNSLCKGHATHGTTPDRKLGNDGGRFRNASNQVYQMLTGNSSVTLTNGELNALLDHIKQSCGSTNLNITPYPIATEGGGIVGVGGDPGPGYYGGGRYPFWYYSMWEFVNWVNSIPVGELPWSEEPVIS